MTEDEPVWIENYTIQALEKIAEHGHMVQLVGGDETNTPLAYTVGLSADERHGYELAVSGLDLTIAGNILNCAVDALRDTRPEEGLLLERVLVGYAVRLRRITGPTIVYGTVRRVYGEVGDVWQVEYPDRAGRFPGEAGYSIDGEQKQL